MAQLGVTGRNSLCPYIVIGVGNTTFQCLVDSGAARSLISRKTFEELKLQRKVMRTESTSLQCMTASQAPLKVDMVASLHFKIECFSWTWKFLVASELGVEVILGADFIAHSGLVLDLALRVGHFKFDPKVPVSLAGVTTVNSLRAFSCSQEEVPENPLGHLCQDQQAALKELCSRFPDVLTKRLGLTPLMEYKIRLTSNKVVRSHPYKLAPPRMEQLRQVVNKLLEEDVIEPTQSAYASPAFTVPKPNGKSRLVIDYRKINSECIEIDTVPLPDLHSAFDWFGKARFFTVFDLNSAYHQIGLAPESRPISTFCVPWNTYCFKRIPMGLAVGAQVLTRLLDMVFHDLKFKYVFNYLDDLVVYSETWESHLVHIEEVLNRLKGAGLTVNPEKVHFAKEEISFLGHLVGVHGVRIDPARTQGIRDFPPPRDVKGIARFLGMVNFYRKFIPNAAELAAPLNELRKKGTKFKWTEAQEHSFKLLKEAIMSPTTLTMPDFSKPFILQTDASSLAIAAVLSQEVDGVRQPIGFVSRTLTAQERKSSIYELECLAVVFGTEKFRRFLEHAEFLLETDNQALSWLLAHPRQLGKLARWVVKIAAFKFKVQHVRSSENLVADTLSRMFTNTDREECCAVNTVLLQFPLAFTDIKSHQEKDPNLRQILEDIKVGGVHPPYSISKEVLCCCPQRGNRSPKIVLPSHLIPMVFSYYHESPVGGHLGIMKTTMKIRKDFIWKGMDRDIATRVKACRLCSLSKPAQNTQLGFLSSEVAGRTMEKLFIDFVGKFPRSKDGNTMLLVCVDAFSKFVWLLPLRRATAHTTIKALNSHIFQHFGTPSVIVSDNGSQFTSNTFRRMCFGNAIRHVTTSAYYPRPNHAERFNRNLRSALIAFHADHHDTWDQNLRWLQYCFNSAKHESHKAVPFEVMFGHPPQDPLSKKWSIEELLPDTPTGDIKEKWLEVRRNLNLSHEKVRRNYNKGRLPNPFKEGELVFYQTHPQSSAIDKRAAKLCYRWSGPHRISLFLGPVTAKLVDPQTGEFVCKAHISQLKKCQEIEEEDAEMV